MNPKPDAEATEVKELKRLNRAQNRLVTAVQELSLVRALPAIQEIVRRAARELVNADGATFVLREGDRCYYADEDAISPLWKGQRFPMSACISGWVMMHGRQATVPDIYADPRIPSAAYRPTFVQSLVMTPIRVTAPVGAIGVYWAKRHVATDAEVALLQALANTTSVAMENVKVYSELEQRVARRTQQLEALNRELESFSYSVSHDLRAPLRAVTGFAGLLALEIQDVASADARHFLDMIRESGKQMGDLIDDLMRLAKVAKQDLDRAEVDLATVARRITARLQSEDPTRAVEVIIPEKLAAQCDAGLMAVVMENLLSNAWKYTTKTSRARIELGTTAAPDGSPAFFVRDNGVGFDATRADRLFMPFSRLHSPADFPGTGVGLATVQRIVHRHGGRVWATSEEGRGATFCFTCPAPGLS